MAKKMKKKAPPRKKASAKKKAPKPAEIKATKDRKAGAEGKACFDIPGQHGNDKHDKDK